MARRVLKTNDLSQLQKESLEEDIDDLSVPEEELDAEIEKTCSAISSKPRGVITFGKKFYHRQMELPLIPAYKEGGKVMAENLKFRDAQEGIEAFKAKRKPVFNHTDERVE